MAMKVSPASAQAYAWIREHHAEHSIDSALEAIKRDLPDNGIVQALTRDALRVRATSIGCYFTAKKPRTKAVHTERSEAWIAEHHERYTADEAPAALKRATGLDASIEALRSRANRIGKPFKAAAQKTPPKTPNDWLAQAIIRAFAAKRPPATIESLISRIIAGLPEELRDKEHEVTREHLLAELDALYWKKDKREELFKTAVKAERDPKELYELFKARWNDEVPLPPFWTVKEKMREMRGRSSAPRVAAETIPGILRVPIAEAKPHPLASTSFADPFHGLPERKSERVKLAVISSPQMGLPYAADIADNLLRSGLSAARKLGCDAIVIGGGLFRLSWQKTAGPSRLLADFVTDINLDPDSVDKAYRAEMKEILDSGRFEPIFTTALERFNELLRGWYKVLVRPDNKGPEFDGPIYIILNSDDLGIVRRMAYFELLWHQHERLLEAQAHASDLARYAAEVYRHGTAAAYDVAKREAQEASRLANRFWMTNLDPAQNRKIYDQALAYFVERIETDGIPGAKVIAENGAYMRFAGSGKVIKFVSGGDARNPHYAELGNYGPAQREEKLAHMTVSLHPRAAWMRETAREDYRDGSMLGQPNAPFVEAPILVDAGPIRERTRGTRITLPVMSAVADAMFAPGMLLVSIDPVFGMNPDVIPAEAVRKLGAPQESGKPRPPAKRMWWMISTDMHFGGANRLYIRRPSGVLMGLSEAALELMQAGLSPTGATPVVGFIAADDLTQGNHFDTHTRPHHNQMPNASVLNEADAGLLSAMTMEANAGRDELAKLVVYLADQIQVRVPHQLSQQLKEMRDGYLKPYRQVFAGILIAAKEAGVRVRGASCFTGMPFDSRDVGLINFGSGNHATKTVKGHVNEGLEMAAFVQELLRSDSRLAGMDLETLVRGLLFQDQSIGYGRVRAHGDDGYEWGLHITGTPPRRDSWLDVLHGWVQANKRIGNPSGTLQNCATLHVTGDKHFFASAFAGGDLYVMGSSSTHTDAFAYIAGGLPENNAGVVFVGLPVEGPDAAELSVVHMQPKLIQDFILSGKKFPWDDFLPHRA